MDDQNAHGTTRQALQGKTMQDPYRHGRHGTQRRTGSVLNWHFTAGTAWPGFPSLGTAGQARHGSMCPPTETRPWARQGRQGRATSDEFSSGKDCFSMARQDWLRMDRVDCHLMAGSAWSGSSESTNVTAGAFRRGSSVPARAWQARLGSDRHSIGADGMAGMDRRGQLGQVRFGRHGENRRLPYFTGRHGRRGSDGSKRLVLFSLGTAGKAAHHWASMARLAALEGQESRDSASHGRRRIAGQSLARHRSHGPSPMPRHGRIGMSGDPWVSRQVAQRSTRTATHGRHGLVGTNRKAHLGRRGLGSDAGHFTAGMAALGGVRSPMARQARRGQSSKVRSVPARQARQRRSIQALASSGLAGLARQHGGAWLGLARRARHGRQGEPCSNEKRHGRHGAAWSAFHGRHEQAQRCHARPHTAGCRRLETA